MTEEDEAFNDIERMSKIRRESVRSSMLKPKTAEEFYNELLNKAREEVRKEPPKYSFKAHWEKDGRIGVVAAIVRSDGGVHILEDIIDMPQRTEQEPWCMKMNNCKTKCKDCPDEPNP